MKKRLLLAILIISVVFAAVGCSYTFDALNFVTVTESDRETAVPHAFVYIFDSEENAQIGYNILTGNDGRDIRDYIYRSSTPLQTNSEGMVTLDIRWVTSSPTDGKDNDQRSFWFIAFEESTSGGSNRISDIEEMTIYSDGNNSITLVLE